MGSLCSSLFGSSASTSYQPPQAVTNAVTDILGRAATQSNQPYPQYTPDTAAQYSNYNAGLLAPMTPNQTQAGQSIAGLQGYTAPNFGAATNLVANAANPLQMQQFSQNSVNQYMNPYLNDVVGSAVSNINQTNAQQQQQVLGNAIGQGAYGGDRAGIAQAELARQQGLANNATIANLLGQGYSQAQGQFNQQQQTDLATQLQNRNLMTNAGLNLANLGTQGQQAALQQAQAQYGYGTAEQQQQQAGLSTAYQQYLNQQAFPYQQLSYYAGLASGAAPALGGTTTGYSPTISPYNAFSGLGVLGNLGGQSAANSGGFLSGLGSAASGVASGFGSLFGLKDGGRVGYANTGGVPLDPLTQAYNDYEDALLSGVRGPQLQDLYAKYVAASKGGEPPFKNTTATAVTPSAPTATAAQTPTDTTAGKGGGNGGGLGSFGSSSNTFDPTSSANSYLPIEVAAPKNPLSALLGGVDSTTGAQTGIMGAINALIKGNSPGTLNAVGMRTNMVADPSQGGREMPNTTSGMTAQQFADQFGLDVKDVKAGIVNGQVEFFNGKNSLANILHPNSVSATSLDQSLIGSPATNQVTSIGTQNPERPIDERAGFYNTAPDGGVDLAGRKNTPITTSGLVDPNTSGLLAAIQHQESGGIENPHAAVGDGGAALGAFQMHNPAARQAASELGLQYDPSMRSDPEVAPKLAQQYLSDMFNYTGSVPGAIAAYQMGPGAYKAAVNAGQDPTQGAYTQNVLRTGLVNADAGVMPPGPAPLPPSNPEYSKGLSEIQAGQNVPGVGAASEGHGGGGGGLDRTVSAPDNSSNESGSSLGGRGNGPSVTDSSEGNGGGEGGGGESDHVAGVKEESQAEHNEKRGGRTSSDNPNQPSCP